VAGTYKKSRRTPFYVGDESRAAAGQFYIAAGGPHALYIAEKSGGRDKDEPGHFVFGYRMPAAKRSVLLHATEAFHSDDKLNTWVGVPDRGARPCEGLTPWERCTHPVEGALSDFLDDEKIIQHLQGQCVPLTCDEQGGAEWFAHRVGLVTSTAAQNLLLDPPLSIVEEHPTPLIDLGFHLPQPWEPPAPLPDNLADLSLKRLREMCGERGLRQVVPSGQGVSVEDKKEVLCERLKQYVAGQGHEQEHTFKRAMFPSWFMRPFGGSTDNMRAGHENEEPLLRTLAADISKWSGKEAGLTALRTIGLVRRADDNGDCRSRSLATSADAVCVFDGRVTAIELKTRMTAKTRAKEEVLLHQQGGKFVEVTTPARFKELVPDKGHRTQVAHHAAVLGVDSVLYVVGNTVGGEGKVHRIVNVRFDEFGDGWLERYRSCLLYCIGDNMDWLVNRQPGTNVDVPRGFLTDHVTKELREKTFIDETTFMTAFGLKVALEKLGGPTRRLRSLIPLVVRDWNAHKGRVDVFTGIKERTTDCTLARTQQEAHTLGLITKAFYNVYRIHGALSIADPGRYETRAKMWKRISRTSYPEFMGELAAHLGSAKDDFAASASHLVTPAGRRRSTVYLPGPQEQPINLLTRLGFVGAPHQRGSIPLASTAVATGKRRRSSSPPRSTTSSSHPSSSSRTTRSTTPLSTSSSSSSSSAPSSSSSYRPKSRCVVTSCDRQVRQRCSQCKVPICSVCWDGWHSNVDGTSTSSPGVVTVTDELRGKWRDKLAGTGPSDFSSPPAGLWTDLGLIHGGTGWLGSCESPSSAPSTPPSTAMPRVTDAAVTPDASHATPISLGSGWLRKAIGL